jgi:hypothetical protein
MLWLNPWLIVIEREPLTAILAQREVDASFTILPERGEKEPILGKQWDTEQES